jgi:putative GTP pyrophosphokinase
MDDPAVALDPLASPSARQMRDEFDRLLMEHQFAVDEIMTKVSILRREFTYLHKYNPIEHVNSRVKTLDSILAKVVRKGLEPTASDARAHLHDIAGIRITCSFIPDTYRVLQALTDQDDLTVLSIKDYIAQPKPNGYKSLHAILEVPVFMSDGPLPVKVEVQIRTVAMDFWASLEHKIYYKYDGEVPPELLDELTEAAFMAQQLDERMASLHSEIHRPPGPGIARDEARDSVDATILQRMRMQPLRANNADDPLLSPHSLAKPLG